MRPGDTMKKVTVIITPLCACGCGISVTWDTHKKQWNKTRLGHHTRLPEERKRISERTKGNTNCAGRNFPEERKQQFSIERKREGNPNWKGGVCYREGRVFILINGEYVRRAVVILESKLNRKLKTTEVVHHINEIKDDDRPENLQVMTNAEHTKYHFTGKKRTSESIEKQRQSMLGKHHSEETKKLMSSQRKGKLNPNFGKTMAKEQKQKIAESQRKRHMRKNNE